MFNHPSSGLSSHSQTKCRKRVSNSDFNRRRLYLCFPLTQAERGVAEGDGRTVRPAGRLGRDVVMGAPTEPAAVAVPVTNPTRDSGGSQRFAKGQRVLDRTSWNSQSQRQCRDSKLLRTINKLKITQKSVQEQTLAEG